MTNGAKQATPHSALIDELMDSRVPKTDREHAACREIEMLRERLAQKDEPSAEPVAYRYRYIDGWRTNGGGPVNGVHPVECQPLYTSPPTRTPLTDEEIAEIAVECAAAHRSDDISFARAIERAHRIGEKK